MAPYIQHSDVAKFADEKVNLNQDRVKNIENKLMPYEVVLSIRYAKTRTSISSR